MKKWVLPLFAGLVVICGCAHQYVIKLTNGMTLTSPHKPKLKGSLYIYKDALGRTNYVPQGRVVEIEPASFAQEENQFQAPTRAVPKKRHWYWPFWKT